MVFLLRGLRRALIYKTWLSDVCTRARARAPEKRDASAAQLGPVRRERQGSAAQHRSVARATSLERRGRDGKGGSDRCASARQHWKWGNGCRNEGHLAETVLQTHQTNPAMRSCEGPNLGYEGPF